MEKKITYGKLTYEKDLSEKQIPTKAMLIQMNQELLKYYQKEINDLLAKGIIRKRKKSIVMFNILCKQK